MSDLTRTIEALLFLSPQPVNTRDLAEATESTEGQVDEAIGLLREDLAEGKRGVVLREVAGGFSLASDPASEAAARRLLAKPRTPALTPKVFSIVSSMTRNSEAPQRPVTLALPPATDVPPITTTAMEVSRYSLPMSSDEP